MPRFMNSLQVGKLSYPNLYQSLEVIKKWEFEGKLGVRILLFWRDQFSCLFSVLVSTSFPHVSTLQSSCISRLPVITTNNHWLVSGHQVKHCTLLGTNGRWLYFRILSIAINYYRYWYANINQIIPTLKKIIM